MRGFQARRPVMPEWDMPLLDIFCGSAGTKCWTLGCLMSHMEQGTFGYHHQPFDSEAVCSTLYGELLSAIAVLMLEFLPA